MKYTRKLSDKSINRTYKQVIENVDKEKTKITFFTNQSKYSRWRSHSTLELEDLSYILLILNFV